MPEVCTSRLPVIGIEVADKRDAAVEREREDKMLLSREIVPGVQVPLLPLTNRCR